MKRTCLLQIAFVLSSLTLSKLQDVIGPGPSCVRLTSADGQMRVTFMQEDAAGERSLYLTLWSQDMRLLACEVHPSPLLTPCNGSDTHGQEILQRFNISTLLGKDAPCVRVSSSAPKFARRTRSDWTEKKSRRKRAWIFPGTLWCGSGSKAIGYEQLGMFESADRCCREHDHCLHIIPAFTVNYGVFNSNFYTVSHCECDQRFRQCLLGANDSISSMVGYSFFNILRVPCFELKQQKRCTEMYWWGMCKIAKEAPYAVFKNPLPYTNTSAGQYPDTESHKLPVHETQHVTKSPVIHPHRKLTKSKHRCPSRDPPRGDTFHRRRTKGRGCKRHLTPSQMSPRSRADLTAPSMRTDPLNDSKGHTLMPNKTRAGKKKGLSAQQVTNSALLMPLANPLLTQSPKLQVHPTTAHITAAKARHHHKKAKKRSHCCGSSKPVRGDTFQPHCKSCLKKGKASHMATTLTNGIPVTKTTETLWNTTLATSLTTKVRVPASPPQDGKQQKEMDRKVSQSIHAQRRQRQNSAKRNMTDNQLQCGSLKHLDECKFKIPPMEKKYDLQNTESKTVYHCDCTRRLALQIESFKQPWILLSLLVDFVSQRCFILPKEKKCIRKESCSRGFTKASDLHQALKKIEEKNITGVKISGTTRKRGIPVRLYKRCIRLQKGRKGS